MAYSTSSSTSPATPNLDAAERDAVDRPYAGMAQYLARIARRRNDLGTAERWYRRWLDGFREDVASWCELGELLLDVERFAAAEEAFVRAATLSPDYAPPWNGIGYARFQRRELPGAVEAFAKAVAAGATDPGVYDAYGLALLEHGNAREAANQFEQAVRADATDGLFQLHLAEAYEKLGRLADAKAAAARARQHLEGELADEAAALLARIG